MDLELGKRTRNSNKGKDKVSKVLLKLEIVMHNGRWSHGCYRKVVLSKSKDSSHFFWIL